MAELVEAAEVIERAFSRRDYGFGVGMGVVLGAGAAYLVLEKRLRVKYEQIANDEIAQMREHYNAKALLRLQEQEKPKLEELVVEKGYVPAPIPGKEQVAGSSLKKARDIAAENPQTDEEFEYVTDSAGEERDVDKIAQNVFKDVAVPNVKDEWDYEVEVAQRTPDVPYVIHVDELGELSELDSLTWTYYEGDEVLCNAGDEVVTDVNRSVGLSNLDKFGHGSGDANVVYIRNVVLGIEIEVIRSPGKYEEEVLGLQHADESIQRRKRHFDDDPR